MSSFDVIRVLRRQTEMRKIGHAGTLDPLASGLMLMLFGAGCKRAELLVKLDKRYDAQIKLGFNSTTGDEEGTKSLISDKIPTETQVCLALKELTGEITQTPSKYSAIKIRGKEAYKRARAGENVEMPSRRVYIYENDLVAYDYPLLRVSAKVSSGTYIRTLAEDLGRILGTGAYLSGLVRISVGEYELDNALNLADIDVNSASAQMRPI